MFDDRIDTLAAIYGTGGVHVGNDEGNNDYYENTSELVSDLELSNKLQTNTEKAVKMGYLRRTKLSGLSYTDEKDKVVRIRDTYALTDLARNDKDFILGKAMVNVIHKHLAIDLNFLGTIPYDENVQLSIKKLSPYIINFPHTETSQTIEAILERLTDGAE